MDMQLLCFWIIPHESYEKFPPDQNQLVSLTLVSILFAAFCLHTSTLCVSVGLRPDSSFDPSLLPESSRDEVCRAELEHVAVCSAMKSVV